MGIGRTVDLVRGVHGIVRHGRRGIADQSHVVAEFGRIAR